MKRDRLGIGIAIGLWLGLGVYLATGCSVRTMRYLSGERNIQDASYGDRVELRRQMEASDE